MGAKHNAKIKSDAIKVHLPNVQQNTNFSCGAVALQCICAYFGVGYGSEYDYIKVLQSNPNWGTDQSNIIECAKSLGLNVIAEEMSIDMLKIHLNKKRPIIVCIQAYGQPSKYDRSGFGHYVIAIGYDEKYIFFEDPLIYSFRGYLTYKQFEKRWHCWGPFDAGVCKNHGIVIWKDGPPAYLTKAKKII